MPTVFLSYRKSDTGKDAARLSDSFRQKVGQGWVFRDVNDIRLGTEFDATLHRELDAARAVLVLIGPGWTAELARRQQEPDVDYVRLEVARSLEGKKHVLPVLVGGAAMPDEGQLPDDLAAFPKRQAMTLRDESWSDDVDRLIDAIGRPYRFGWLGVRAVGALLFILLLAKEGVPRLFPERASDYDFLGLVTGGLVLLYGLVELGLAIRRLRRQARSLG